MDYVSPQFDSAALLTIDTQVDTLDGQPLEIPGTSAAVPQIASLASAFRDAGRPIVHIVRLYRSDGSNVDLCRRVHDAGYRVVYNPTVALHHTIGVSAEIWAAGTPTDP